MHTVAIVALDGVVPFDLSIPTEVFRHVRLPFGGPGYQVRVCGLTPEVHAGAFRVKTHHGLGSLARADTIFLPGIMDLSAPVPPALLKALRAAAGRGTRIASICTGAFLLAATGLLDGLRATTHWMATEELARRHPAIQVDPNVLYVDNGQLLTSAGAAAGLDLCLHVVRRDHGDAVAADAARLAVMPLERDGGQSQFITHVPPAPEGASLEPLLHWMEDHLHRPLTLQSLARKAAMSERTLSRHFREQTGTTPLQWLLHARVRRAQHLLETTGQSVEAIAQKVGFGSVTTFREHFQRFVATSPLAYRRAFRGGLEGLSAGGRSAPAPPGGRRRTRAAS
ncbi:GlxA family transcriptional regulator [Corallococcus sp. 4LFB]|uniref:GlxA family transcriptional regulator n=1 Tax=Corallococcus sp. 4LFB TaxID=3383249 RepID=UPI003976B03E